MQDSQVRYAKMTLISCRCVHVMYDHHMLHQHVERNTQTLITMRYACNTQVGIAQETNTQVGIAQETNTQVGIAQETNTQVGIAQETNTQVGIAQ